MDGQKLSISVSVCVCLSVCQIITLHVDICKLCCLGIRILTLDSLRTCSRNIPPVKDPPKSSFPNKPRNISHGSFRPTNIYSKHLTRKLFSGEFSPNITPTTILQIEFSRNFSGRFPLQIPAERYNP